MAFLMHTDFYIVILRGDLHLKIVFLSYFLKSVITKAAIGYCN